MKVIVLHHNHFLAQAKELATRDVAFSGDHVAAANLYGNGCYEPVAIYEGPQIDCKVACERAWELTQHGIPGYEIPDWNRRAPMMKPFKPTDGESLLALHSTCNRSSMVGDLFQVIERSGMRGGLLMSCIYVCKNNGFNMFTAWTPVSITEQVEG